MRALVHARRILIAPDLERKNDQLALNRNENLDDADQRRRGGH